jgi:predicted nucleic acid-binding protein
VDCIIDASTLINLHNASVLKTVASIQRCYFFVSPAVVFECRITAEIHIAELEGCGKLRFVHSDSVPAETYLDLLMAYQLGEGETECIALALFHPYVLCCDDAKARSVAAKLLGESRVVGSLRLLKWCVEEGVMSYDKAFSFYEAMKSSGGFLPDKDADWFRS